MFCTCCGAQVKIPFAFCPSCGESLRNDRQASTDRGGSTWAENVIIEISGNRIALASVHPLLAWIRADQKFYLGRASNICTIWSKKVGRKTGAFQSEDVRTWKTCVANRGNYQHWFDGVWGGLKCIKACERRLASSKIKTSASYQEVLDTALKKREAFDHKFSISMQRGYHPSWYLNTLPSLGYAIVSDILRNIFARSSSLLFLYVLPVCRMKRFFV